MPSVIRFDYFCIDETFPEKNLSPCPTATVFFNGINSAVSSISDISM
jgi:hypothetical protein